MSSSIHLATFCASLFSAYGCPLPFVCRDVDAIESPHLEFGRSRGAVLGPLNRISQPAGPGFVAWVEGWCADFVGRALLVRGVVWCRSDADSVQNR